jgi:putative ABC transport system permease protein
VTEDLFRDLRHALRRTWRARSTSCVIVGVLGLGIGANAAVFGFVRGLLLSEPPYRDPDRLVRVQSVRGEEPGKLSALELEDLREQARLFESFAAVRLSQYNLSGDGRPEVALASINTYDLFALLGASPLHGQTWPRSHDKTTVFEVVLGHGLWQRRFGGDRGIVGRSITLDSAPYTVLGVMPPGFDFPGGIEIYRRSPAGDYTSRATRNATIVARMKPGVTLAAARAELRAVGERLAQSYPDTNAGVSFTAGPLRELWIGDAGAYLRLLFAAVALVQLTVCANVVSLLLSRALARRRDTAVRAALGAGSVAIARALVAEGVVLGLLGSSIGVPVAFGLVRVARTLLPVELPYWMTVSVDLPTLGFALLLGILSGLVAGALPGVETARSDLAAVLRDGTGASAGRSRQRLRRVLVAGQVALSVALVAGAALLARALVQLHRADLGFDPGGLLTLQVDPPWSRYNELWQTAPFYRRALEEIRALPGVEAAATNDALPLVDANAVESQVALGVEGQSPDEERANPPANVQAVSPGYFAAMRVPLLRGRDLEPQEGADHVPAAVVSRRLALRFFPGQDPLGRRVRLAERGANFRPGSQPEAKTGPWLTIVGVAGDVAHGSPAGPPGLDVYLSDQQSFVPETYIVVRAKAGDPRALSESVRKAVLRVDRELAAFDVADMPARVRATIWPQTLSGSAVSAFAVFALLLAALGLFGLLSLLVTQRAREIAVRMAIGAGRDDVTRLVLGEAAGTVAAGVAIGAAGAFVLHRLIAPMLGAGQGAAATVVAVSLTLAATALLAAWHPVRRALAVDPREALRAE